MTAADVQKLIAAWRVLWPAAPWRAEDMRLAVTVWAAVLADIDYPDAEQAIIQIARSGAKFPPAPGEIVHFVHTERSGAPPVHLALAEVAHYVTRRGLRRGPPEQWSHPAVAQAARAIGWAALCDGGDIVRAHFLRAYESARTVPAGHTLELSSGRTDE